jgi:hypothetical protein
VLFPKRINHFAKIGHILLLKGSLDELEEGEFECIIVSMGSLISKLSLRFVVSSCSSNRPRIRIGHSRDAMLCFLEE